MLTKREAAIITAYTGYLIGSFDEYHKYITEIMERPVYTHELGNKDVIAEIQKRSMEDFVGLEMEKEEE